MAARRRPSPADDRPLRVIGYVRVSTDRQDNGPEAQIATLTREGEHRGWLLDLRREDAASAKSMDGRPVLAQALVDLRAGRADMLAVAKLDRLSRSVVDFATILEDAGREGWRLACLDLGMDTSTAMGEAMAHMAAVFAQMERRRISERTKEGLAVVRASGTRLGPPVRLPSDVAERIVRLRGGGLTLKEISDQLADEGVPTAKGGRWWPATVGQVEARWLRDRAYARDRMGDPGQPVVVHSDEEAAQVKAANDEQLANALRTSV